MVSLERIRFHLRRLGRPGALGALLIAGAVAWQFAVVLPRAEALAAQLARNADAERAAQAEQAAAAAAEAAGVRVQPTLAPAAAASLRRVFEAAEAAGVELPQGEYRLTEIRDAHLRRYQLSLPVSGDYPGIRRFLTEALNADPALALAGLQLRRARIESDAVEGLLNFTLYLEVGA